MTKADLKSFAARENMFHAKKYNIWAQEFEGVIYWMVLPVNEEPQDDAIPPATIRASFHTTRDPMAMAKYTMWLVCNRDSRKALLTRTFGKFSEKDST